jgi:hypothetical protein
VVLVRLDDSDVVEHQTEDGSDACSVILPLAARAPPGLPRAFDFSLALSDIEAWKKHGSPALHMSASNVPDHSYDTMTDGCDTTRFSL